MAAGALSGLHGFVCISLRGNQIASGLALALFGTGLRTFWRCSDWKYSHFIK